MSKPLILKVNLVSFTFPLRYLEPCLFYLNIPYLINKSLKYIPHLSLTSSFSKALFFHLNALYVITFFSFSFSDFVKLIDAFLRLFNSQLNKQIVAVLLFGFTYGFSVAPVCTNLFFCCSSKHFIFCCSLSNFFFSLVAFALSYSTTKFP